MFKYRENLKNTIFILIINFCVFVCHANENSSAKAKVTTLSNFKPSAGINGNAIKLTSAVNAINIAPVSPTKEGPNKRNIKDNDLNGSYAVAGKSYDPPAEFYRGPGSTSSSGATTDYNKNGDNTAAGFISKPVTFPDGGVAGEYNKWQLLRGQNQGYGNSQDRISIGHYGSSDHSTSHGGASSSYLHNSGISPGYGYGYDSRRPYDGYHNDYSAGGPQYPVSGHGGGGGGGYYIGSNSAEGGAGGIPFDVYGSKGHYAGAGGEYSYSSYPDSHETAAHKGNGYDWQHKALLAKSFLIPLASAAVLGIAAALVSNPYLLQLGTVSGPAVAIGKRRRKRRDLSETKATKELTKTWKQKKHGNMELAYRAHRQRRSARV